MDIQAVAFDVDGTLYSNRRMYLLSVPVFFRHPRFLRQFGKVRKRIRKTRPIDDFRRLQAEMLAELRRTSPEKARILIEKMFYEKWENNLKRIRIYPELIKGLNDLKNAAYPLGVLSDFPVKRKLKILGLEGLWDCALSSEDTGYLKPNPEPFWALADCLGKKTEKILYVGNNYHYDVVGAHNAGLKTAHLTKNPPSDSLADINFSRYRDLFRWLEKNTANAKKD